MLEANISREKVRAPLSFLYMREIKAIVKYIIADKSNTFIKLLIIYTPLFYKAGPWASFIDKYKLIGVLLYHPMALY